MGAIQNVADFVKDFSIKRTELFEGGNIGFSQGGKIRVDYNASTAFTWMIQAAASCKHYASDIIYDIDAIRNTIDQFASNIIDGIENEEYIRFVAVRDMGVDSTGFIANKIDKLGSWNFTPERFKKYYKALFRVTITEEVVYGGKRIRVVTDEFELKGDEGNV